MNDLKTNENITIQASRVSIILNMFPSISCRLSEYSSKTTDTLKSIVASVKYLIPKENADYYYIYIQSNEAKGNFVLFRNRINSSYFFLFFMNKSVKIFQFFTLQNSLANPIKIFCKT